MINCLKLSPIAFALALAVPSGARAQSSLESEQITTVQSQVITQEGVAEDVKKAQTSAETSSLNAEREADDAKKRTLIAKSETEKALASYLSEIQNYRAELSKIKLVGVNSVDEQIELMRDRTSVLKQQESALNDRPELVSAKDLEEVTLTWRKIVDEMIASLFQAKNIELNDPPRVPPSLDLKGEKYAELKLKINDSAKSAEREKLDVKDIIANLSRSEKEVRSRLLLNSGRIRADFMEQMISKDQFSAWDFQHIRSGDLVREVQVVPYKFIASFTELYFDFRSLSRDGANGWLSLTKQIILLLFVLISPFILFRLFRMFSDYLDRVRREIFTNSQMDFKKRTKIALWIGVVNPYLPWLFALLAIEMASSVLASTLVGRLSLVLPYLSIYVFYRLFRIIFSSALARILLSKRLDKLKIRQLHVQDTAKKLSVLFFTEWAILHATKDAVREALIFNIFFDVVVVINILVLMFEARKWKEELLLLAKPWLHTKFLALISNSNSLILDLVVLPIIFICNVSFLGLDWLYQWLGQFEIGKRISSEVFKKRLEDAAEGVVSKNNNVPLDYRSLFLTDKSVDENVRVTLSKTPLQKCLSTIELWKNGESHEDLLLLYGNFGIGKSTLMNAVEQKMNGQIIVRRVSVQGKITTQSGLYDYISKLFDCTINCPEDLEKMDQEIEKTIVLIDDIHNLYINNTDGLDAYKSLIDLTSLQLNNVFWCFTCNQRALLHLNGLFGKNHFLGEQVELLSWTDFEIQELILKRHRLSDYGLKFDRVISAVHKGDILEASSGLEVQFFRLLWGQSRGNPSTAQELWLTATNIGKFKNMRITVPEFTSPRALVDLSDEAFMVFAAVVKHENLSYSELRKVCGLPASVLRQAIKIGEDGFVLQKISLDRWQIHPKAQYVVHSQLIGRNLIYG